jgi:hypothetical protein
MGGDYTPSWWNRWTVDELAEGIRDSGANQLMTVHCGRESPAVAFGSRKWLNFSNVYSYAPNLSIDIVKEYNRVPVRPFILIEGIYEFEHDSKPERIRKQAYVSLLTGAAGHFYGNNPVWNFGSPHKVFPTEQSWREALDSQGAKDMTRLWALFNMVQWSTLVPDVEQSIVVTGYGQELSKRYLTAAVTHDGKLAIVYVASEAPNNLYLDFKRGLQYFHMTWIDPTESRTIDMVMLTDLRNRKEKITMPGSNHSGQNDWILIFRAR